MKQCIEAVPSGRKARIRYPNGKTRRLFAEWAEQFVAMSVDRAPATINRRVNELKNWCCQFGRRPLGSITQPDVRAWVAAMTRAGCNAGSVKLRYETLDHLPGRS